MKMVDMELPKKSAKELKTEAIPAKGDGGPKYPYGLELRFENETISKIPYLKNLEVGDKVTVQAVGEVTGKNSSEYKTEKDHTSVTIQLQEVGCEPKKKEKPESMGSMMKHSERYA